MNKATDPVLEVLSDAGIPVSRAAVNNAVQKRAGDQPSRATVYRSFDPLESHGLIRSEGTEDSKFFEITDQGHAYLAGDLDASELESDSEDT